MPLADVAVSADGKRLAVTADGYWQNLLVVEDQGDKAVRVGQPPRRAIAAHRPAVDQQRRAVLRCGQPDRGTLRRGVLP